MVAFQSTLLELPSYEPMQACMRHGKGAGNRAVRMVWLAEPYDEEGRSGGVVMSLCIVNPLSGLGSGSLSRVGLGFRSRV